MIVGHVTSSYSIQGCQNQDLSSTWTSLSWYWHLGRLRDTQIPTKFQERECREPELDSTFVSSLCCPSRQSKTVSNSRKFITMSPTVNVPHEKKPGTVLRVFPRTCALLLSFATRAKMEAPMARSRRNYSGSQAL